MPNSHLMRKYRIRVIRHEVVLAEDVVGGIPIMVKFGWVDERGLVTQSKYINPNMVGVLKKVVYSVRGTDLVEVESCSAEERICHFPTVGMGEYNYTCELLFKKFGIVFPLSKF